MYSQLLAAAAGVGTLGLALPHTGSAPTKSLTAHVWASASSLTHMTASGPAALSGPNDLVRLGSSVYVAFQNGVGSKGEASSAGNTDSTIVEFSAAGAKMRQWDVAGKVDGMGAAPAFNAVMASVNEDGNSSLYELRAGRATHFTYSPAALPSGGGTDAITAVGRLLLVSGSAPTSKTGPAVYAVRLQARNHIATASRLFADNARATTLALGRHRAPATRLALTDPDSNTLVPASIRGLGGDFALDSQGDQELIFASRPGTRRQSLAVLKLTQSIDDFTWATQSGGEMLMTDSSADAIIAVRGRFTPNRIYADATPCDANSAPSSCSTASFFAAVNPRTGAVTATHVGGVSFTPAGMLYLP